MRRTLMTAAVLAATLTTVALPAAASADPYWHGGYGWHGGRDGGWDRGRDGGWDRGRDGGWDRGRDWREWRAHDWREHHRYGYGYGGYYDRPYAYARPPVVYVEPYRY